MVNAAGNIVACEMDGRLIEVNAKTKAGQVAGRRLRRQALQRAERPGDRQGRRHLLHRSALPRPDAAAAGRAGVLLPRRDGKVTRLGAVETAPNGVILSPDEKTLYVIPSLQAEMLAYPVEAPGKIGPQRTFCTLKQAAGKTAGGGDGLTIDTKGNLYITSALGVQVFSPAGKLLGIIEFPEQPANCTFGGTDNKTLYVTARTSLYCRADGSDRARFSGREAVDFAAGNALAGRLLAGTYALGACQCNRAREARDQWSRSLPAIDLFDTLAECDHA